MAERLAGRAIDFERADQSPRVVRMNVRRGDRIDLRESLVERGLADFGELVFDLLAQFPIGGRPVEQAAEQALEIERRAADEEDLFAAGFDISSTVAAAASTYWATLYSSAGSTMSSR